jgi:hypothetical protein
LWKDANPVAPWEFVKAVGNSPPATLNSGLQSAPPKAKRPTAELTNLNLMNTGPAPTRPASTNLSEADLGWAAGPVNRNWKQFHPPGENFSALVPEDGKLMKTPVPFGEQMVDVNYYLARDGWSVYAVMWITGPSTGETDTAAINGTLTGFLKGVGSGYESRGGAGNFSCEPRGERNISSSGYTGKEFDLSTCTLPAMARAYTKVVGGQRQMYIGSVFFMQEDANVMKFLKSFNVGNTTKQTRPTAKAN